MKTIEDLLLKVGGMPLSPNCDVAKKFYSSRVTLVKTITTKTITKTISTYPWVLVVLIWEFFLDETL